MDWQGDDWEGSASSGSLSLEVDPTLMLQTASGSEPPPEGTLHTSGSLLVSLVLDTTDSRDILRVRRFGSIDRT